MWTAAPARAPGTGRHRRLLAVTLAAVMATGLLSVGRTAHAQDSSLRETAATTWVVRPDEGRVDLTIDLTLDGGARPDEWELPLPMHPDRVRVRRDGEVVPHEVVEEDDLAVLSWDLAGDGAAGSSETYRLRLRFASAPPRSALAEGPRISNGFVAVPIWAWGTDGAELRVRVPERMAPRLGVMVGTVDDEGWVEFAMSDAVGFAQYLVGASDDQEATTEARTVGDTTVEIQAWPDDPRWGRRVGAFAVEALPALAQWTGTPWDGTTLAISETATPVVEGWGGWNDSSRNVISVGEEFDTALWTHELSHNWFDRNEFSEPWLAEGLAETATAMLADDLGVRRPPVAPDNPPDGVEPLLWWDVILLSASMESLTDPEAWYQTTNDLYDTAHYVVDAIARDVGEERFREIVGMTLREESAWGRLGTPVSDDAADWREFLDLAERVGGSEVARDLLVEHVVPDAGPLLERRDELIAAWEEMAEEPWGVPAGVATEMHGWQFDRAEEAMARARETRSEIRSLRTRAKRLDVEFPRLRRTWRTAGLGRLDDQVEATEVLLDDVAALRGRYREEDLGRLDLDLSSGSGDAEQMRLVVTSTAATLDRLVNAEQTLDRVVGDPVADVGLAGSDPAPLRERARTALAEGDLGVAATATNELVDLADGAMRRGWGRLGGGLLAIVLLLVALVGLAGRRRPRHLPASEPPLAPPAPAATPAAEPTADPTHDVAPPAPTATGGQDSSRPRRRGTTPATARPLGAPPSARERAMADGARDDTFSMADRLGVSSAGDPPPTSNRATSNRATANRATPNPPSDGSTPPPPPPPRWP